MKSKNKVVLAGVACAVSLGVGFVSNYAYADGGPSRIYVYDGTTMCNIYNPGDSSADCGEGYGEFVTDGNILTLGTKVDGKDVVIVDSSNPGNSYTIKADADITANLSAPGYGEVTFDLGEHSWTESSHFSAPDQSGSAFIMESGTLNIFTSLSCDNLVVNGGVINTSGVDNATNVTANEFTMNGGKLVMENGDLKIKEKGEINGGELSIKNQYGFGGLIDLSAGTSAPVFTMNGGTVSLDADGKSRAGIYGTYNDTVINIKDGSLNISNVGDGIYLSGTQTLSDSAVNFDGGVTTIKNASKYAIDIRGVADYKKAIAFGDDMGIKESGLYVFYDNYTVGSEEGYWTGVVADGTVTIAEGGTVKRVAGWEIGDGDEEDKLKVPDTGAFSSSNSAVVVAVSLASLATASGALYAIYYAVKRKSSKVGFKE